MYWRHEAVRHYIIPIFIPHLGCPHTCVFCSQRRITGAATNVSPEDIARILDFHLSHITREYYVEAAFYGGSFTALPGELQEALLQPAAERLGKGGIDAIRLSTRPDYIDSTILRRLQVRGVRTIELGAQSFDDRVLAAAGRGHTAEDIRRAGRMVRQAGFSLGIQLMPGLPGDTMDTMRNSLEQTLQMKPSVARIYPTVVIRDTVLAGLYEQGKYVPLSLPEAVHIAALMKLAMERQGIKVIRTGLQSGGELDQQGTILAGPYHPAFGEMVESHFFDCMTEELFERWPELRGEVVLHHAPRDASKLRGQHSENLKRWQEKYPQAVFRLQADGTEADTIAAEFSGLCYNMSKWTLKMGWTHEGTYDAGHGLSNGDKLL